MTKVRQVREEKGLTMQALAAAAGLALSSVAEIEAGRTRPRIDTVWALAVALSSTPDELFPRDDFVPTKTG